MHSLVESSEKANACIHPTPNSGRGEGGGVQSARGEGGREFFLEFQMLREHRVPHVVDVLPGVGFRVQSLIAWTVALAFHV